MSERTPFDLLDRSMQRFVWSRGWKNLNPLQEKSIRPILACDRDCVISAATASGKTEAAFLPAISYIIAHPKKGVRILYVSPLKALINDQYRRLLDMCNNTEISVTPWHGDVSANKKHQQVHNPSGIILITPESLESLLINRTSFIKEAFASLDYVIIDEFHAFISGERGAQLFSQLHRIENLIGRTICRICLSATFSNFKDVSFLVRPHNPKRVEHIEADDMRGSTLALKLYGYLETLAEARSDHDNINLDALTEEIIENSYPSRKGIADDIFKTARGTTNLIFTNSRTDAELIASILRVIAESRHVPNEFFPHHGSLSKEMREDVEDRLIKGQFPTTAICTSTLELGIDISDVTSIGQINAPFSVASLRQRLGRSGRRGGRAILRLYSVELEEGISLASDLCENTVTSIAMLELLLERWYEPPQKHCLHTSTLVQQILSVIASYERVTAKAIYELLCRTGPFTLITPSYFAMILRSLGANDYIIQLPDGSLTLGEAGERRVSNFEFYAAFFTVREFRIVHNNHEIGRTPFVGLITLINHFILGGKSWEIIDVDKLRAVITVKKYVGSDAAPLPSLSAETPTHERIRQKMLEIYMRDSYPSYLDNKAKQMLKRAREKFFELGLDHKHVVETKTQIALFPWSNNNVLRTVRLLLLSEHLSCDIKQSHLELSYVSAESLGIAIASILRNAETFTPDKLLRRIKNVELEKFLDCLNKDVQNLNYYNDQCDLKGALTFLEEAAIELGVFKKRRGFKLPEVDCLKKQEINN